jgi:hypothetical protein
MWCGVKVVRLGKDESMLDGVVVEDERYECIAVWVGGLSLEFEYFVTAKGTQSPLSELE